MGISRLRWLVVAALLPIASLVLFTPYYQTNDDVGMRLLAEGHYVPGQGPLPYLLFINIVLGKLLTLAYRLSPALSWYDFLLGGSMVAAAAALASVWTRAERRGLDWLWTALLAGFFLLRPFVSVQFSLAGMACSAAGVALIAQSLLLDDEAKVRRNRAIAGAALFVLGSLIRFDGALLIAIEGGVLVLVTAVGNRELRPRLRTALLAAAGALVLSGAGWAVNRIAYRQAPGWASFYEYNSLRARLAEYVTPDRIDPEVSERLLREVGWSQNDFSLFRKWFFTDPQLFNLEKVRRAEQIVHDGAGAPAQSAGAAAPRRALDLAREFFVETQTAFLLLALFVVARGARRQLLVTFAAVTSMLAILIVAIGLTMKTPPQRIFWPMLIMAATILTIAAQRWSRPTHWALSFAAAAIAAHVVWRELAPLRAESQARRRLGESARMDADRLRLTGATMVVLHADAFPYEYYWRPLQTLSPPFDFIGVASSGQTPPIQGALTRIGATDLPWSLCTQPGMLLVAAPGLIPTLETFLKEHRATQVRFDAVSSSTLITAWRCSRQ